MKAVQFTEHGGPAVLEVAEVDRPEPADHELLIDVHTAGVNPVDTYFRDGSYTPPTLPFTPGVDVAGTVAALGPGITDFEIDDRVFATGIGNTQYQGSYAEYAIVPHDRVVRLPETVPLDQAGTAGVAGVTAWRALYDHANLTPTEWCLIHGGSGGVGHVAVQLANAVNARVIATAAPEYHDRITALGADTVLDYARDDLADAISTASDGGVSVILDHRLDDYLQLDAEVADVGARIVGIGENDPAVGFTNDGVARSKDLTYTFMSMFNTPDFHVPLRGIAHLMANDVIRIEIADTYPLSDAAAAQRDVLETSFLGKFALTP